MIMQCLKCKKEIFDSSTFCPICGAKQTPVYKELFVRNALTEEEFIDNINKWFQWHPNVANVKVTFDKDTSIGLLVNKYKLEMVTLEYELLNGNNKYEYGIVKEEKFALMQTSVKEYIEKWKSERPGVKVVNWTGGVHSRGQTGSLMLKGIGARNRMTAYIVYKFPRNSTL